MTESRVVLAIDLGTSTLKVGLVNDALLLVASASSSHPTLSPHAGTAEQRPSDWIKGLRHCVREVLSHSEIAPEAIVLTGQMPTLVALDESGAPLGNAVTWQDTRANEVVRDRLALDDVRRVYEIAGTPIDGRYLIPMHLRRLDEDSEYAPHTLLSARDYLYFVLTGALVTDPSTASGFGNYSLVARAWDDGLTSLWGVSPALFPTIVDASFHSPLNAHGVSLLGDVRPGTPVYVGGADSICAHHYVSARLPGATSVIEGSSTVIMAPLKNRSMVPGQPLVTPLVDSANLAVELDLLATGSSVGWLASILDRTPAALEELAISHPSPASCAVTFSPYLASGEQGVLWRDDLRASISGLTLDSSPADLALALFEGIAFETTRCLRVLSETSSDPSPVCVVGDKGRHFGAALLGALVARRVVTLDEAHPALLGAALIAMTPANSVNLRSRDAATEEPNPLSADYAQALVIKASKYLATVPGDRSVDASLTP